MKNISLTLVLVFNIFFSNSLFAYDQSSLTYIQGNLCSQANNGSPVPGLLVSLVHPNLGRSVPVYTDNFGNFLMINIPKTNVPYYLEVYWGERLIYRIAVTILAPVQLPRVCI